MKTLSVPVLNVQAPPPAPVAIDDEQMAEIELPRAMADRKMLSERSLAAPHSSSIIEMAPPQRNSFFGSALEVRSNFEEEHPDAPSSTDGGKTNQNVFAVKKTLVQGMMDVALITANANQLRYIIEFNSNSSTYHFVFTMILLSIVLQLIVGISLIWIGKKGYHHAHDDDEHHSVLYADLCDKFVLIAVFFITIINVFIATFPINGHNVRH